MNESTTGRGRGAVNAAATEPDLDHLALNISHLVAGSGRPMLASGESFDGGSPQEDGITLEEISRLLRTREQRGFNRGYSEATTATRNMFERELGRERAEAVAGALLFVLDQVTPVIEVMSKVKLTDSAAAARRLTDADRQRLLQGRTALTTLAGALRGHAAKIARGEALLP